MELSSFDILTHRLPIVFCGINPSVLAVETGHNFGSPSNRFWRVLHKARFTPLQLNAEDDRDLTRYGCGITAAVARGTRRASELSRREIVTSSDLLQQKVNHFRPEILVFLGKSAFATIMHQSDAHWGRQDTAFGNSRVWLLPNPSGLNRNFDLDSLVAQYSILREEADSSLRRWVQRQTRAKADHLSK